MGFPQFFAMAPAPSPSPSGSVPSQSPAPSPKPGWEPSDTVALVAKISWPLAILLLAILLLLILRVDWVRAWIAPWMRNVKSVSGFGLKIELDERAARVSQATFDEVMDRYRRLVDDAISTQLRREQFDEVWQGFIASHLRPLVKGKFEDVRFTIYVPDLLFEGALYQLVDYSPKGGGRGRRLSIRFGAVGRAWRLQKDSDMWQGNETAGDTLLEQWGMTRTEMTQSGNGKTAFGCILLKNATAPGKPRVALIYMDSQETNAFGQDRPAFESAALSVIKAAETIDLAQLIEERLLQPIRGLTPALSIAPKEQARSLFP
jgi:hypothetical protein